MQGNDLKLIQEASKRAREALSGKTTGFGLTPPSATKKTQNNVNVVSQSATATQAAVPATDVIKPTAPLPALRSLTEDEILTIEHYLKNGDEASAEHHLSELKNASLNDAEALRRFDDAMAEYSSYLIKESSAWRTPITIHQQGMAENTYSQNKFRRFLQREHAKRTGTESAAQFVVTQFENTKVQSPVGRFYKELVAFLSAGAFTSATQLLHTNDKQRFQISTDAQKIFDFAIEAAQQRAREDRQDLGYQNTVAATRRNTDSIAEFNNDLKQFRQTLDQYISGEPLRQYEAPNPYRGYYFGDYNT